MYKTRKNLSNNKKRTKKKIKKINRNIQRSRHCLGKKQKIRKVLASNGFR